MDSVILEAKSRGTGIKAKDLLKSSIIPAEYYGKGVENKSIQLDYQNFRRVFRKTGSNTIIELKIDDKEAVNVLVHDIQYNPVTDEIKHVDFINIRMGEKLRAKVPLEFIGVAPAVKELGGIMTANLHEIEIECLPKDLIHNIQVNIEPLVDFNHSIKVSDLQVPATVVIVNSADEVVVTCSAPREEVEEEPIAAEGEGAEGAAATEGDKDSKEGAGSEGRE